MKKLCLFVLLVVVSLSVNSQPLITIYPDTIDFGEVAYRSEQSRIAKIYNHGNEPLLLTDVKSSCGCTVPTWTQDPINPLDSTEIEIEYNTYLLGKFQKTVTVYSNDTVSGPQRITIMGEVLMAAGVKLITNEELQIYPNPATEIIYIDGLKQAAEIKIYSTNGQLIKSGYNVQNQFDISELDRGIYIVNLKIGKEVIVRKVLKE